ncbi:MAG TPA: hypothetical protein VHA37_01105, partial [Candidatus Saccharimonadales bacterium]|nr:hypothetical protein [Candidatus Saccharimonadales bacterium]
TTSAPVDNMTYHYRNSELSNQLDYVAESGGTTAALGDFKDGHTGAGDYAYDSSGNLTKDLNKAIASISYNPLNLPTGAGVPQATGAKAKPPDCIRHSSFEN